MVSQRVDAKVGIEQWRRHWNNEVPPHSSLAYLTPTESRATQIAETFEGGRSTAMPARAARKNENAFTVSIVRDPDFSVHIQREFCGAIRPVGPGGMP